MRIPGLATLLLTTLTALPHPPTPTYYNSSNTPTKDTPVSAPEPIVGSALATDTPASAPLPPAPGSAPSETAPAAAPADSPPAPDSGATDPTATQDAPATPPTAPSTPTPGADIAPLATAYIQTAPDSAPSGATDPAAAQAPDPTNDEAPQAPPAAAPTPPAPDFTRVQAATAFETSPHTRTLSPQSPARALGIPAGGAHRHIRVRTSETGATWSPWIETPTDPESGTLVWFDAPARLVEVQGAGDEPLMLIDPGVTPPLPANARAATPDIRGRADWCPAPFVCPKGANPTRTTPTHLVVHHTASANAASDWAAVMRSFWELHVKGNGWDDIGYNFLVDPAGTAWEGRGDGVLGAHFSAVNTATAGISLIGTFTSQAPSPQALDTLVGLLNWQAAKYSLDPLAQTLHSASGLELNVISGHRDAGLSPRASGRTECPGVALYPLLPALRERVCQLTPGCRPAAERPNSCASAQSPCLSRYGVVNSATFDARPVARGSIAAAFGANLEGLTALVNGRQAPIVGATPNQLNILIPAATEPGTARLQLTDGPTVRAERLIWVTETAPAIYAALNHDDQTVNAPSAPVAAGRPLTLYLAGAQQNLAWSASLGSTPVTDRLYLGPAPGFPGLWQANLVVPDSAEPGPHDLTLSVSGVPSPPFRVEVRRP